MPRRRLRTFALWTGTLLCVLIAAAFVASGWWISAIQIPTPYGPAFAVNGGVCGVILDDQWSVVLVAERSGRRPRPGPWRPSWRWWNHWNVGSHFIFVPLYAAFAAVAIPTLLAWRFVPKFPRGHCRRYGYNLKGLTEPRCPECGTGFGTSMPSAVGPTV